MPSYASARILGGDVRTVRVPGHDDCKFEVGDLTLLVDGMAVGADDWDTLGSLALDQAGAHDVFLGISLTSKSFNQSNMDVEVAVSGRCKYPCAPTAGVKGMGALVGLVGTGGLENQVVAIVATPDLAIGSLVEVSPSNAPFLVFELASVLGSPSRGVQAIP